MDSTSLCEPADSGLPQHDLKVIQRAFCTWILEYFIIWWIPILFHWQNALVLAWTPRVWVKTYRLMLPRHDLKLIQISFCTWVSECLTLLCLNVRIHSSCMDSTRLCRTCSLRSSQHDFKVIQRAPCVWTSERLVWSEFGLSSFCFYENMHSGWHGLDKFLLFWFILQLKQKIIKLTVHFWWCFVPQVMALFTHTDRWRFVFYGLHCEQLGSDAFLQLHKNTAGDGGASHCASVQCLVKRFASQFQVAPHNHLCVKIATQR